jgi:hypothetical protein
MAKQPTHTYANTAVPNGGYNSPVGGYSNVTIASTGINYTTATSWSSSYNTPKVKITETDIEIDGLSLKTTLQTLQERLAIMQVNPALEREFEELRACAEEYRRLEKKFEEQKRMWDTLKKEHK